MNITHEQRATLAALIEVDLRLRLDVLATLRERFGELASQMADIAAREREHGREIERLRALKEVLA